VECACVRGRVPGFGAFQTQLVPGLSLGIWGIPEVPGLGAFHTQSRFISTQAGDAGWRSGGVYTGAFVPFIPLACRVGRHACGCGQLVRAVGYRVRAVCGWGASWLLGIPCEGGRRVILCGRGAWRTFPFCASPCARARGPTTAAFVAIVSPAARA
jgi:hypothetical protein